MPPDFKLEGTVHGVTPLQHGRNRRLLVCGDELFVRARFDSANECDVYIGNCRYQIYFAQSDSTIYIHLADKVWTLTAIGDYGTSREFEDQLDSTVRAPMPCVVVDVMAKVGDRVSVGDTIVVIESMKLQCELCATIAGKVVRVSASAGAAFERNASLVEIEPDSKI